MPQNIEVSGITGKCNIYISYITKIYITKLRLQLYQRGELWPLYRPSGVLSINEEKPDSLRSSK